eukprot:g1377.t1
MTYFGVVILASILAISQGQDPAEGWMAYAVGKIPSNYERITKLQMTWTVGEKPRSSFAFFSPWFGMDPADNLNLVQPVNPWGGRSWSMYTEYFQWSPEDNSNSDSYSVEAGQNLTGVILYDEDSDSYKLTQTIVETGETSSQNVKCQDGKKYVVPYVVYEKVFACRDYPPDEIVTFRDIEIECDGKDCREDVEWEAKVKDANCNMEAHIDKNANTISITWDTDADGLYDSLSPAEMIARNYHGWGKRVVDDRCLEMMEKVCPGEKGKKDECEKCIQSHKAELEDVCAHTGSGREFCGSAGTLCDGVNAVFNDMHDGDSKMVTAVGGKLLIEPHGNNQTWRIEADLGEDCTATVDFDVPGKPSPPPVKLFATFWKMQAANDNGKSKLAVEFTDPSGTIAPPAKALNVWIEEAAPGM